MLLIQTALHAEARTLIKFYGLKRQHEEHAFACFKSGDLCLVESGSGKINTAAAVGWLSSRVAVANPVWLNLGLAGHANDPIGSLRLVHRVEDQDSGHRWYPSMLAAQRPESHALLTVNQPVSDYPDDVMVDMEASGFFTAAMRFTTIELIQSLKIISDNRQQPPVRMKARDVDSLFEPQLDEIDNYIQQLISLRRNLDDPTAEELEQLLQRYHFSAYQRHALHRLLQRYTACYPDRPLSVALPPSANNGKTVIQWLTAAIEHAPVQF